MAKSFSRRPPNSHVVGLGLYDRLQLVYARPLCIKQSLSGQRPPNRTVQVRVTNNLAQPFSRAAYTAKPWQSVTAARS